MRVDEAAEIQVWTGARDDGRVEWFVRVDGANIGGRGTVDCHWEGVRAAADFLRDHDEAAEKAARP